MVALDAQTLRPRKAAPGEPPAVPPLALESDTRLLPADAEAAAAAGVAAAGKVGTAGTPGTAAAAALVAAANVRQSERAALAAWHQAIRRARTQATMQIRQPVSAPPTAEVSVYAHISLRRRIHFPTHSRTQACALVRRFEMPMKRALCPIW
jgi:hypothetical protein